MPRLLTGQLAAAAFVLSLCPPAVAQIDGLDREPINYATAAPDNVITALQRRITDGTAKLGHAGDHGYLPAVLRELNVPGSSQVLVFSKTSFQRERIGPATPRALYFNDDVYVGFCLRGDVLEFSAADPGLGTAFYTLDQEPGGTPRFLRQRDNCLACHASSATGGAPGHLVRSVFTDRGGLPVLSAGTYRTTHASPFAERWGGWYVTGTHGKQVHMGNWILGKGAKPEVAENRDGQNVTDLRSRFTVANYLTPHSDIVALMVLEHQAECHNRLAQAMIQTRQARHYEAALNRDLNEPAGKRWDSAVGRIKSSGEQLVRYLLFSGEAKLDGPVAGTSEFAAEFAGRGPFDARGRSLRQFDLRTRLFKYPCSYLVYSRAFAELPPEAKEYVLRRMHEVLTGADTTAAFAHLSAADRLAVLQILRDTLPDLPEYWKK